ncbi:hypothetical protein NCS56_00802100 [Fusarium sp. Ph1]|nr:hypothetical protein NCS56_00802100 [Fusarium sp. Ph1]
MTQQVIQGPHSRQPLSSSEFRNDRLTTWLRETGSSWNVAQSSETQGALHARSSPSLAPPDSPLLSCSTTASSCISDCSPQHRVSVPPPLGLSDPVLAGTGMWFASLSSRPKKNSEACYPESPPQLRPEVRLNASFREILFNNPDYAERLIRTIQNLPSEDRNILPDQSFDTITSLGGGHNTTRARDGSRRASTSTTPVTQRTSPSSGASNKRKTPPSVNQQRLGKAPDNSPGSGPGGGSAIGHRQSKKSKTSDFLYLCPYRRIYHVMTPQNKFRSCQPPGHLKDSYDLKRHLEGVHVRTQVSQDSKANDETQGSDGYINPDYSMDKESWNKVAGIFKSACSKRFTPGSENWLNNERDCYQEIWKIILPNQPIPESPFYEDSVDGHPLIEVARRMLEPVFDEKANRAIQAGQVTSLEDYRPSRKEAIDMMAVTLATLFNTKPQLLHTQSSSDILPILAENTPSTTAARSSHDHVISQDPSPQTTMAPPLPGNFHQSPVADPNEDQQHLGVFDGMTGNIRLETPIMTLLDHAMNTATATNPLQTRRTSAPQICANFYIEPPTFEITLKGRTDSDHIGVLKWEIPVPKGLVVERCEQRKMEPPINYGQPAMCGNLQPGVTSLGPQVQGAGEGSITLDEGWSELADISSNFFDGGEGTFSWHNNYQNE